MLYHSADLQKPAQYCTSGNFICEEGGAVHPARKLSTFVILFGCEGEYRIEQNETEYRLAPGSFLVLLADHPHRGAAPCPPGLSHYWCHFLLREPYTLMEESSALQASEACRSKDMIPADYQDLVRNSRLLLPEFGTVSRPEKFRLLFRSLTDCARSTGTYRSHLCDLILTQLLYELADAACEEKQTEKDPQTVVSRVLEYIRLHADTVCPVEQIAEHFGYHPEYLTTLVRRHTGRSILQHINGAKIETSKKLLLSTDLSIAEIAMLSGFEDAKYFSRLFRRFTDTTPSEFRNAYSKLHINR